MKYKHIVFDVDGTLINNEEAVLKSWQAVVKEMKNELMNLDQLSFTLGIPGSVSFKQLEINDTQTALSIWNQAFIANHYLIHLFKDITTLLSYLKKRHYHLGIVTSKTNEQMKATFKQFNLKHFFDIIICADDTTRHKPNPDPLIAYRQKANIGFDEMLYIGDSIYDLECAKHSGVDFALALWGGKPLEHTQYCLNEPFDLINLLNEPQHLVVKMNFNHEGEGSFPTFKVHSNVEVLNQCDHYLNWLEVMIDNYHTYIPKHYLTNVKLNCDYNPTELIAAKGDLIEVVEVCYEWFYGYHYQTETFGWIPFEKTTSLIY